MQNDEGWLTHLSAGVGSQSEIPSANHLHHKGKSEGCNTLAYILLIGICYISYYSRSFSTFNPDNDTSNAYYHISLLISMIGESAKVESVNFLS